MNEREIFILLREACEYIKHENRKAYDQRMAQAKEAIDALPEHRALQGEWLMASALACPGDLDRLLALYRKARELIGGRSRLLPRGTPLFDYYSAFSICNIEFGHADENAVKLSEVVQVFYALTGGGLGTDVCYRAQLAYYRGQIAEARLLAARAFELAEQKGLTGLWAAYILANIAKHEPDRKLWRFACSYIGDVANGFREADRACREQAQMLSCMLDLSVGLLHSVPKWVKDGDFGIIPAAWGCVLIEDKILRGTLELALMVQLEYESYSNQPVKMLNIADIMQKVYSVGRVAEYDAYLNFFRAGCYRLLDDKDMMKEVLLRALKTIAQDKLWLIVAEFKPAYYGELLLETAEQVDKEGAVRIREIGEGFWEKLSLLRNDLLQDVPASLTRREQEIAALLTEGRTNNEIAKMLCISERTVKGHLTNIFSKYNVSRRTQVAEAMEKGGKIVLASWISGKN